MGSSGSKSGQSKRDADTTDDTRSGSKVTLNVYAFPGDQPSMPGFGAWHSGVEVNGVEYTFGKRDTSLSGIVSHKPRAAPGVTFKESVDIGTTSLSGREIRDLVNEMGKEFPGNEYHVTGKNCNHFSDAFCKRLCGTGVPGWVNRVAKVTHAIGLGGIASSTAEARAKEQMLSGPVGQSAFQSVQVDLRALLDPSRLECLNEHAGHTLADLLAAKKPRPLRSDADPQLLLAFGFRQPVRLTALVLRGAGGAAPRTVRLYANRRDMDFGTVEGVEPTATLTLDADALAGRPVPLPQAQRFTNIRDLTMFVVDNCGAPYTEVQALAWIGAPHLSTDMSQFKPVPFNEVYRDAD